MPWRQLCTCDTCIQNNEKINLSLDDRAVELRTCDTLVYAVRLPTSVKTMFSRRINGILCTIVYVKRAQHEVLISKFYNWASMPMHRKYLGNVVVAGLGNRLFNYTIPLVCVMWKLSGCCLVTLDASGTRDDAHRLKELFGLPYAEIILRLHSFMKTNAPLLFESKADAVNALHIRLCNERLCEYYKNLGFEKKPVIEEDLYCITINATVNKIKSII